MKFSTYLETIAGVSIYPVISLTMFVLFFSIVIYRIVCMNKEEIQYLENLPLEDHKK